MKKANGLIVAAAFIAPLAFADNPNANQRGTMVQAFQSVSTTRNPTAPGIAKASDRVFENSIKHSLNDHGGHAAEHGAVQRAAAVDRPDRVDRADRPQHVERLSRVDRPDTPGPALDRPQLPGRGLGRPDFVPGRGRGR